MSEQPELTAPPKALCESSNYTSDDYYRQREQVEALYRAGQPLPPGWKVVNLTPQSSQTTVLAIGSKVTIGSDIEAAVMGVWIQPEGVQYSVSWWDGRSRRLEWLHASELRATDAQTQKIGFV